MKKKRRLFFWIYPPYLITVLLSAIAFTVFTAESATTFLNSLSSVELKQTTILAANIVEPLFIPTNISHIQKVCKTLVSGTRVRLTIINLDGLVISDTDTDPAMMDIHLNREEIRQAILSGSGSALRKSASTGITTTYEALALHDSNGHTVAILRAAMPYSFIGTRRKELVMQVLLFGITLTAAVSLLSFFLAHRLSKPILRIHTGAQAFSSGLLHERIPEEGPLEIANLATVLNRMASDLDERIRMVAEQKNQVEAILNGMSESVVVVDENLGIHTSNPAFKKLFGGDGTGDLLTLTRNTELCDFMEASIHSKGPLEMGLSLFGDTQKQLRLTSAPLGNNRAVLVVGDLTKLNRLETVRKDFTANVSHELKTPITAIKASLETLKDALISDPDKCAYFLEIAIRGTERLETILTDILALARIEEEEKNGMDMSRVSLDPIIRSVIDEVSSRPGIENIRIEHTGKTGLSVAGHEGLIRQAFFNLIDNALKYASKGELIEIKTETDGQFAVLSVKDYGPGIPERDKKRLFERFYRVDKARSRETGGTGLGLSIVKHIARAHSGSVRVESSEGIGSTFSIVLPLAKNP